MHFLGVGFKAVLANAQYNSAKVKAAAENFGANPVILVRKDYRVKDIQKVGRDFLTRGARRLVELFSGRWSVEIVGVPCLVHDVWEDRLMEQTFPKLCLQFQYRKP